MKVILRICPHHEFPGSAAILQSFSGSAGPALGPPSPVARKAVEQPKYFYEGNDIQHLTLYERNVRVNGKT